MKKFLAALIIVVLIVLFIFYRMSSTTPAPVTTTPTTGSTNTDVTASSTATTSTSYKDGSYTGSVADAFYGKVQVQATIAGGRITAVTFLQYPNERGNTTEISNRVMPILTQEAITVQSANVDIISGATQTSQAFQVSLKSALAQAQA